MDKHEALDYFLRRKSMYLDDNCQAAEDIAIECIMRAIDGDWISVEDRLPEDDRTVLAVKQLKDGRRDMCLARCIPEWEYYDAAAQITRKKPYWVCGGNNNIILWMPLPKIPEKGE